MPLERTAAPAPAARGLGAVLKAMLLGPAAGPRLPGPAAVGPDGLTAESRKSQAIWRGFLGIGPDDKADGKRVKGLAANPYPGKAPPKPGAKKGRPPAPVMSTRMKRELEAARRAAAGLPPEDLGGAAGKGG